MNLRTFLTAGVLITAGLMLSRVLGLVREALIAASYGISADANMAIGLLIIPDYITGTLIGSALGSALVPALAARNEEEQQALFWQAMLLSIILFTVIALLVHWQSSHVVRALYGEADGLPEAAFFWALISMPLAGASGVMIAWQQFKGRMQITAFAHAVFNLVIVLGLWLAPQGLMTLGISIFVAGLVRVVVQAVEFFKTGGNWKWIGQKWQVTPRLLSHYLSTISNAFFSLLPQYMPYFVITLLAGRLALFNYAFKLVMLPSIVLSTLVQMLLLPRFVHLRKGGLDIPEYARSFRIGFVFSVCVALAASMASHNLVSICFGYGAMKQEHLEAVSQLFIIGIWAVPFIVAGFTWQQVFYANEQPGIPFKVGLLQALLCVPAAWYGQYYFLETGVMASSVLMQLLGVILLIVTAQRSGLYNFRQEFRLLAQMLVAAFVAFIPLAALYDSMEFSPVPGVIAACLVGAILVIASFVPDAAIRRMMLGMRVRA